MTIKSVTMTNNLNFLNISKNEEIKKTHLQILVLFSSLYKITEIIGNLFQSGVAD